MIKTSDRLYYHVIKTFGYTPLCFTGICNIFILVGYLGYLGYHKIHNQFFFIYLAMPLLPQSVGVALLKAIPPQSHKSQPRSSTVDAN